VSGQAFPAVPGAGGGGTTAIQSDGWFGHGIDGDLTVSGTTTLTRNTFYNNLTITATGTLKPAGWRVYVLGTLTIDSGGTVNDDGLLSAGGATGTAGGLALALRGSLGAQSTAGGAGSAGGTNGTGSSGTTNATLNSSFALPNGGNGGAGGGNAGGTAGAPIAYNAQVSLNDAWPCLTIGHVFGRGSSSNVYNGGGGGAGGGAGAGSTGGGGGSGGGGVWVAAKAIANSGRISANGGAGAGGTGAAGGGGGGGAGGYAIVVYQSGTLGTVQAIGGTGGAGAGTGVTGANGTAGISRTLKMG
jgi:hypothetical protein